MSSPEPWYCREIEINHPSHPGSKPVLLHCDVLNKSWFLLRKKSPQAFLTEIPLSGGGKFISDLEMRTFVKGPDFPQLPRLKGWHQWCQRYKALSTMPMTMLLSPWGTTGQLFQSLSWAWLWGLPGWAPLLLLSSSGHPVPKPGESSRSPCPGVHPSFQALLREGRRKEKGASPTQEEPQDKLGGPRRGKKALAKRGWGDSPGSRARGEEEQAAMGE